MNEISPERRTLLAFLLAMVVLIAWSKWVYKPPQKPAQPTPTQPAAAPPAAVGQPAQPPTVTAAPPQPIAPKAATEERTIVVENGLYRVEFSNRGGVVRSWQLKKYKDDSKPPRTLDVVRADVGNQLGGWPLSLALEDAQLEKLANEALFEVTPSGSSLRAPTELAFEWSDGHLSVTKRLRFAENYVVEIDSAVQLDGKPLAHAVAWRGGFGDATVYGAALQVRVFFFTNTKFTALDQKKLGTPDQPAQRLRHIGTMDYAGIEDRYFAAAFLPRGGPPSSAGGGLALWHWKFERDVALEGKLTKEPLAEMAAGTTAAGPVGLRLFVGPKALDELSKVTPPLAELVQFGWFTFIALPLFYALRWIYGYIPNYGWAIVLITVAINTLLFPLKVKSWRSMQKMQRVMPEIKAIQERYKKYSMRDPRKQQMQQEVMAVYKREGVNPMGGCLPMALQMPVWFALYQMLNVAIELRHAPWILWIKDLSARDPYYVLPVLMGVTMYIMQKMTPVTTADPTQQRMMTMMPIMFGGMFVIFPISSGLVLYILTSNVVGMAQQWFLNKTAPAAAAQVAHAKKKRKE